VTDHLTVLVAARDERHHVAQTVRDLRDAFPEADIVVADDGSLDDTAALAEKAGARVVRLPRRGKGQALTLAEPQCDRGPLLLCDADIRGDLRPLLVAADTTDVAIARFARRTEGGFGIAKRTARALVRLLGGIDLGEPLSGQRALSVRARAAVFPVAAGFGVETRMAIDAARAGLTVHEVELELEHRSTARDLGGFQHRGRQLHDLVLACGPQAVNHRGLRLPLVGAAVGIAVPAVAPVATLGLADDLWSGPERGFRQHLRRGATTGTLKLVGIPLYGALRTRSLSGGVLVGLTANLVNQLDTRPGRALKAFGLGSLLLGDAGSNALGAVLGLRSVERITGWWRIGAIGALASLTALGERRSLGKLIESTPLLREMDAMGRRT
jgi:Glycosyl transferase family 2